MKTFRTTGACIPGKNYMVDITARLVQIKAMVDRGDYFTINRARQYGKTTTLGALKTYLAPQYDVISLDFQRMTSADFMTEGDFVFAFCEELKKRERGNAYNERGEQQLSAYLDDFHLDKGYMLSYNFNRNKAPGVKHLRIGGKELVEAVV